jgi:hypothetical protein
MEQDGPRRGRRPFAGPISDEAPPSALGPLGGPNIPVMGTEAIAPEVAKRAAGAVLDKLEPTRIRVESLGRRTQGMLLLGAGAMITIAVWVIALATPDVLLAIPSRARAFFFVPQVIGPALAAYGVFVMLEPPPPLTPDDHRFGGVLVEAQAERRWKMRLGAIAVGLVHLFVFGQVT